MKNSSAPFKAHPWHGISAGEAAPEIVMSFIEIVPTDTVKFEIDKESGYLILDRPQKYSNHSPTLYGFIPRTYSGKHVAKLCGDAMNRADMKGDGGSRDHRGVSPTPCRSASDTRRLLNKCLSSKLAA